MHDPFSMRPFFGYNFGDYCKHWLSLHKDNRKMPKIFNVNWFRKSEDGKGHFLWPGFGENVRVLEWIFKRVDNVEGIANKTPFGYIPTPESFDLEGLDIPKKDLEELFSYDLNFWMDEANEIKSYFDEYVNDSTPKEIYHQIQLLTDRIKNEQKQ